MFNQFLPSSSGLGLASAVTVIILIGIRNICFRQQQQKKISAQIINRDLLTSHSSKGPSISTTNTSQTNSSSSTSKFDIERGSTYFGAHVFSYEELEEAIDNFNPSKQLGECGFDTVYYGELRERRVVAVKRLYDNNFKRVDQYINEIEILIRIRHLNLQLSTSSLTWHVHLSITVDTTKALAYLHASEIIHRDVKSNNILLDKSFLVKVADFGLSRLFPNDVTHVSTALQGTPGYVDPKIQNRALHEPIDPSLGFENDCAMKNKVTVVAKLVFRCLQQERDMRPSMGEVLVIGKRWQIN
ncbi:Detected protein of confused Function [Hibiscus syriacus]|uniref:Detected protein of confused Function n=1 Tax=Hibiscus syriacus TaxID=106335 RepID=A0A6A2ZWD6_HIBSY|nr:Detected protein of confused Function [Hibiscus syriacus]